MGRAARWLRALFGGRKTPPPATGPKPSAKEKKRWGSFVKSFRENDKTIEAAAAETAAPYDQEQQNKRAIAVATATAAVAEAAVAAAQAAAAVVRLTSSGRVGFGGGGKRGETAAVKIQAAFRAYLARRAFRALKGLVKLQAIVRGNIVRKQAAETLRCMQALVRVQARARACRALRSNRDHIKSSSRSSSRSHLAPSAPEKSEQSVRLSNRKTGRSSPLKRTPSKQTSSSGLDQERSPSSSGYRWLDQWMEECYCDTANSEMIAMTAPLDDEKNAKVVEIDTGKPHYNPKRKTNNFTTVSGSPSKDSTIIDAQQQTPSPLRFQPVDGCDFEESPRFFSVSSRPTGSRRRPFTPAKSECSRSLFSGYSDYRNYMANTESSRAKVRSQSAPRQRSEYEKSGSTKRGYGGGGGGLGQQWQWSLSHKAYPGSGRLDRLGMPVRI